MLNANLYVEFLNKILEFRVILSPKIFHFHFGFLKSNQLPFYDIIKRHSDYFQCVA